MNAADERTAIREGNRYRVSWSLTGGGGVLYFRDLAAALQKQDAMCNEHEVPIPKEYYEDNGAWIDRLSVRIDEYVGGSWQPVADAARTVVAGVNLSLLGRR